MLGLIEFCFRLGVRYDTGAYVVGECAFFVNQGTDRDVELGLAIEAEVTDRSGVEAASAGLEFRDDLGGAFFGRAGDGSAREA